MIPIPRDYDTAPVYEGQGGPRLTPGGHVCVVKRAYMDQSRSGRDMLVVDIDIDEGSELDGYYQARYERNRKQYGASARWPGKHYLLICNNDGTTSGRFKGFITALEDSNGGYDFRRTNGDEKAMKGLHVGICFGEKEYEGSDGAIRVSVKPVYATSVSRVRDGLPVPALKKLEANGISAAPAAPDTSEMQEVEDDDLPF